MFRLYFDFQNRFSTVITGLAKLDIKLFAFLSDVHIIH